MDNTWLSIIPATITIAVAIWSKKVLPSLLLGLLVGSYLLNHSVIGGLETAIANAVNTISDKGNLQVLLFLYLFSGLIALVRKAGGITAFSAWVGKFVHSEKGVFFTLWALLPVTFIDCAFRIIGAGSIMRPLVDKHKIAKERFAFMLNNTASPIVELIPIATTFVGFNIANISQGMNAAGGVKEQSAYSILLHSIPYQFFSIVVLFITFFSIFFQWKKPSAEKLKPAAKTEAAKGMDMDDDKPAIKPRMINLATPMLTVICFSFFFFWYFGRSKDGADGTMSSVIAATDPNKAMLVALFVSIIITGLIYWLQKYPLKTMTADLIGGGNKLMEILAILVIAWSLGAVSQELKLSDFIQQQIGKSLPEWSIPASLFITASAVTYFLGSGWAASALIMPFAISLAVTGGSVIPMCVAAVITGGTFGDVTSPVAGMTNMASNAVDADQVKYLKYANPYNFTALAVAAMLFVVFGIIG